MTVGQNGAQPSSIPELRARLDHDLAGIRADLRKLREESATKADVDGVRQLIEKRANALERKVNAILRAVTWKKERSISA